MRYNVCMHVHGGVVMVSQRVQNYIDDHKSCSECLFRDWEAFLDILYAEGGRVSAILWWDHCRREEHHESVGSGGYIDPEDDGFIYAETQFYEDGLETKTLDEIKEYIEQVRRTGFQYRDECRSHDLVPSFYLAD